MKLLFDQNLSYRLAVRLADVYPGSMHVRELGMASADDKEVWEQAMAGGFAVVSKDSDFYQRSLVLGHPPKLVWIRRGNCSTSEAEEILRRHAEDLLRFDRDQVAAALILQ